MSLAEERELLITPIVPENVVHNTKILENIRSLTAPTLGVAAGILGLESLTGFAFYLAGSFLVSVLILLLVAGGSPKKYFRSQTDIWTHEVFGTTSLSSFVLMWTLFYNLVRA
ncbi:Rab5-interacting protein-domain-containing protein [Sphaerosporella brunnea]|uniref:ER membrane protein complex subunit 6 n=1 Tax=Sphaerosporella brunnea TaxID=1250544 RepID=A0A5J5ELU1_9PEZI|nr:Rab5-interacting protein-domain-containing protein [Sphaerosporella brunnea]